LRVSFALAGFAVLCMIALFPTPYFVMSPGTAVDLSTRIAVGRHAPPYDRFYLTDVSLQRASVAMLLERFLPARRLVLETALVPPGISARRYDAILVRSMTSSQEIAAVVAERAAGFTVHVPPAFVVVEDVTPASRPRGVLAPGDALRAVGSHTLESAAQLASLLARLRPGAVVELAFDRAGRRRRASVRTIAVAGKARLGVVIGLDRPRASLPVPVRFTMDDVAGSSGGLMFALAIYASLRPARPPEPRAPERIAGTGTLALDGSVGAIDGVQQKLAAAKRAGARVFFVPRANGRDLPPDPAIRIVPVDSFREALLALGSRLTAPRLRTP